MQYLENLLIWAKTRFFFHYKTTFPFLGTKDFSQGLERQSEKKLIDFLQLHGEKRQRLYSGSNKCQSVNHVQ